jgi:hypothetical protein
VERELSTGHEIGIDAIIRFENTIRNELQYQIVPVEADFDESKDLPITEIQNPPHSLVDYNENDEPTNISAFSLRNRIGEVKQGRLKQLLSEGELPNDFKSFNQKEILREIISQAFDNFLEQKDVEKLYHEWGYKTQHRESEFGELSTDEQQSLRKAIKKEYINNQLFTIHNVLGKDFFDPQNINAGIIFCPHRRGLHGVTDQYRYTTAPWDDYQFLGKLYNKGQILKDDNNNPIPYENPKGIADRIDSDKLRIGTFLGSGDKYDENSEKAEKDSITYQDEFVNNKLNLMIATKAFGMGVDKTNIRYTIHFNVPSSIESFVQESGRAGRDRQLAINYILFNQQEFSCWNDEARIALLKNLHKGNQRPTKATLDSIKRWLSNGIAGAMFWRKDYEQIIHEIGKVDPQIPVQKILESTPTLQVDKDNLLVFHTNAFKGKDKELSLIHELLTEITFPHYQRVSMLSEYVSSKINREVKLSFSNHANQLDKLWGKKKEGRERRREKGEEAEARREGRERQQGERGRRDGRRAARRRRRDPVDHRGLRRVRLRQVAGDPPARGQGQAPPRVRRAGE